MEMNKKRIPLILSTLAIIYVAFIYLDFSNSKLYEATSLLKFSSITLVLLLSFLASKNAYNEKDIRLLKYALSLTLIADFFLLFVKKYYLVGVIIFSIVQTIHSVRYRQSNSRLFEKNMFLAFLGFTIAAFILKIFADIEYLMTFSVFYAITLTLSVFNAINACIKKSYPMPNRHMIAFGMILFLLCDVNVGLFNLTVVSSNLIWVFYLPSQVLLALSGFKYNQSDSI